MSAWGIAFTPDMLDALRAGRKTVMRRPITDNQARCHYTSPTLMVKERLAKLDGLVAYAAGHELVIKDGEPVPWPWKHAYLPERFMPRWAARLWLTDVQVSAEQLGSITEADAWAEGVLPASGNVTRHEGEGRELYQTLWEKIHGPGTWDPEAWVWRISFRVEHAAPAQAVGW